MNRGWKENGVGTSKGMEGDGMGWREQNMGEINGMGVKGGEGNGTRVGRREME